MDTTAKHARDIAANLMDARFAVERAIRELNSAANAMKEDYFLTGDDDGVNDSAAALRIVRRSMMRDEDTWTGYAEARERA